MAALWGGHPSPRRRRRRSLRGLLLAVLPLLVPLAKGDGRRSEELFQEAALRLLEDFLAPREANPWRAAARQGAPLWALLRVWAKSWAPGVAEALLWGISEERARHLRALRARASRGDTKAQEELDKLLLEGITLSLEGLMTNPEGEMVEIGVRDPRPYPGEEE